MTPQRRPTDRHSYTALVQPVLITILIAVSAMAAGLIQRNAGIVQENQAMLLENRQNLRQLLAYCDVKRDTR